MNSHLTSPKSNRQPTTQSLPDSQQTTLKDQYQPMSKDLSAKPTTKTKSSTHLGITISWKFQPPGYLSVTTVVEGAARRHLDPAGAAVPTGAGCSASTVLGGGVPC